MCMRVSRYCERPCHRASDKSSESERILVAEFRNYDKISGPISPDENSVSGEVRLDIERFTYTERIDGHGI